MASLQTPEAWLDTAMLLNIHSHQTEMAEAWAKQILPCSDLCDG